MKMSNQEAIEIIELARAQIEWDYPMDYVVAFDMAISAIKAQDVPDINVGDMVSRQKTIDALCRRCDLAAEDDEPCTEKCNDIKILEKLPSAQPEYTELTPEEAASEIASGSTMPVSYWLNDIMQLKQMGYAICKKTL